jgi:hypothetical protein
MRIGSIEATNGSRPSGRSVTPGLPGFNTFGICNAMGKYWQTPMRLARSMFTQCGDINGQDDHRGQTCPYRIFR